MSALEWPSEGPLADQLPASDLLVLSLRNTVLDVRSHEHPASSGDLYCLNLTSFMGDRMAAVLKRLAAAEAEIQRWKDRCSALADEALVLVAEASSRSEGEVQ